MVVGKVKEISSLEDFKAIQDGLKLWYCWLVVGNHDRDFLPDLLHKTSNTPYTFFTVDPESKAGEALRTIAAPPVFEAPYMVVQIGIVFQGFDINNTAGIIESLYLCLAQQGALVILGYTSEEDEQRIFLNDIKCYLEKLGVDPDHYPPPNSFQYNTECTQRHFFLLPCLPHISSRYCAVTVLINPSCTEVEEEIKQLFSVSTTGSPYVAYAGHADDEGDWVLRDDHFTHDDACIALQEGVANNSQFTKDSQGGDIQLNCC